MHVKGLGPVLEQGVGVEVDGDDPARPAKDAGALGGVDHPRHRQHRLRAPGEAVAEADLRSGGIRLARAPVGDSIVVDFLVGGDFHQGDRALAPVLLGFDPQAGAVVIEGFQVVEIRQLARALHQAEAARVVVDEGRHLQPRGVGQRPPQGFTVAVDHQQAIAVMAGLHRAFSGFRARCGLAVSQSRASGGIRSGRAETCTRPGWRALRITTADFGSAGDLAAALAGHHHH